MSVSRMPGESDKDYIARLEAAQPKAPKPPIAKIKLTSGAFVHPVTGAPAPKRWNLSMGTVTVHVTDSAVLPTKTQIQAAKLQLREAVTRLAKGEYPTDDVLLAEAKALQSAD